MVCIGNAIVEEQAVGDTLVLQGRRLVEALLNDRDKLERSEKDRDWRLARGSQR